MSRHFLFSTGTEKCSCILPSIDTINLILCYLEKHYMMVRCSTMVSNSPEKDSFFSANSSISLYHKVNEDPHLKENFPKRNQSYLSPPIISNQFWNDVMLILNMCCSLFKASIPSLWIPSGIPPTATYSPPYHALGCTLEHV